jgi:hypothetical protein
MVADDADGPADGSGRSRAPTVRADPLETNAATAADGADAKLPPQSTPEKDGTLPDDDLEVLFDERAGIMEFDAGLSRAEAEARAAEDVAGLREVAESDQDAGPADHD